MTLIPNHDPDTGLPALFLKEVRDAYFEGRPGRFSSTNLIGIAENASLRAEFERLFQTQINDPELRRRVLNYLRDTAATLEKEARSSEPWVDALDRYVAPMSGGIAVAGSVALAGVATAAAALLLIGGSLR